MARFLSLQDQFIDLGGARTLCALLHSKSERLMFEAAMTISYIVSDSESNRKAIAADEGYVFSFSRLSVKIHFRLREDEKEFGSL